MLWGLGRKEGRWVQDQQALAGVQGFTSMLVKYQLVLLDLVGNKSTGPLIWHPNSIALRAE
jgi:hypothetical protein